MIKIQIDNLRLKCNVNYVSTVSNQSSTTYLSEDKKATVCPTVRGKLSTATEPLSTPSLLQNTDTDRQTDKQTNKQTKQTRTEKQTKQTNNNKHTLCALVFFSER